MAMTMDATRVERELEGVRYPATKEELLQGLAPDSDIRSILERLPDQTYVSQQEVAAATEALGSEDETPATTSGPTRRRGSRRTLSPVMASRASATGDSAVMRRARRMTTEQLGTAKAQAASKLMMLADVAREGSDRLRTERQEDALAEVASAAAGQIDRAATFLRETEPTEIVRQAETVARRSPLPILAGSFVAAFALVRLLKASPAEQPAGGVEAQQPLQ